MGGLMMTHTHTGRLTDCLEEHEVKCAVFTRWEWLGRIESFVTQLLTDAAQDFSKVKVWRQAFQSEIISLFFLPRSLLASLFSLLFRLFYSSQV